VIRLSVPAPRPGRAAWHRRGALALATAATCLGLAVGSAPVWSQAEAAGSVQAGSAFDVNAVRTLLQRGDAAVAAGNLAEARRQFDQARDAARRLLGFYRSLSGAFRGLDARIPREMDDKGRQTLDLLADANMRLAALFRRQGQPEVAVPLLVEVVTSMTPTTEVGRRAYQQLIEIGFVTTPYTAPVPSP
jgi:lipopolysaccharide biosynthesis regulator YciM